MARISICNLSEVFGMAEEQTLNTEACGCEIYTVGTEGALLIHYCPLHAAASEMYDLMLEMHEELENAGYVDWPERIKIILKEIDNG